MPVDASPSSPPVSFLSLLLNSELIRWLVTEFMQFWREGRFHGTYKVEDHYSTLELVDRRGKISVYSKRQLVTFTQDGVFAIQDQAWGDGEIFAGYSCTPGIAADRYKEGYRWKILISLRTTKNKDEQEEFFIQRRIKDGFTTPICNFQTQVDHPTKALTVSVIFPKTRHPKYVHLIEQNMRRSHTLGKEHCTPLSNGRVQYSWHLAKPHLYEGYILRWEW